MVIGNWKKTIQRSLKPKNVHIKHILHLAIPGRDISTIVTLFQDMLPAYSFLLFENGFTPYTYIISMLQFFNVVHNFDKTKIFL